MTTIAIVPAILLALCIAWYFDLLNRLIRFVRIVKFSRTIRGPPSLEFIRNGRGANLLPFLGQSLRKYGSRFGVWVGKDLVVFITSADDVKRILSSQELIFKSITHDIMRPWLGDGLLLAGGEKWKRARKLLTPAFHFNILRQFQGAMNECGEVLVRKLDEVADGRPVDVYPFITLFALDVISETAMGIKQNVQLESGSEYAGAVQGILHLLSHRAFSFFLRNDFTFKFSGLAKQQEAYLRVLHGVTNDVIETRRKAIADMKGETMDEALQQSGVEGRRRLAFLDMLLIGQLEGKDITDLQIREEVDTFMFEGHDTTSSAISFILLQLSRYADVQERAFQEAVQFIGRESEPMPYLEAVIKETLRLYPSVPMFSRTLRQDFKLGDTVIPRGVSFSMMAYLLHRNPDEFLDPEAFNPDRFIDNHQMNPFAYVAFSAGPRNCIGQKFAVLELKSILTKLLRRFEFRRVDYDPVIVSQFILKSANGIRVQIHRRN